MKRVVVTGGTGFIGRHCIPLLCAQGFEVHALSSSPRLPALPGLREHRIDLLDTQQVSELMRRLAPTHLLHLAWGATARGWSAATREDLEPWVQASLHLGRSFVAHGGRHAVAAGTCAEYRWGDTPCDESTTPLQPATAYGAAKHALHQELRQTLCAGGASLAWARIFFVYGPFEPPHRLVPSIARALLAGEPAPCSHGEQRRDYLHVEDVATALVALLEGGIDGAFNVGSGNAVRLRDLITRLATELDRLHLVRFGALPVGPHETPLVVAATHQLRAATSWLPRYNLNDGLRQTLAWWAKPAPSLAEPIVSSA